MRFIRKMFSRSISSRRIVGLRFLSLISSERVGLMFMVYRARGHP